MLVISLLFLIGKLAELLVRKIMRMPKCTPVFQDKELDMRGRESKETATIFGGKPIVCIA